MVRKAEQVVTFRAAAVTLQQLEELSKKWGENRSRVISRAVAMVYQLERTLDAPPMKLPRRRK